MPLGQPAQCRVQQQTVMLEAVDHAGARPLAASTHHVHAAH
jgi:hypothetical protein